MPNEGERIVLSLADIRACMMNIEVWARFITDALDNYSIRTGQTVLYSGGGTITPNPPRISGCPPPEEGSWSPDDDGNKDKKPKKYKKDKKGKKDDE
jgi:hypothetical protein